MVIWFDYLKSSMAHLGHKPLLLLYADVQQLGLIQDLVQAQGVSVASLVPRLEEKETKIPNSNADCIHVQRHVTQCATFSFPPNIITI